MNILDKLTILMEERGINNSQLSKGANIPYTTVDGFFKKGMDNVKLPTLKKLAKYFDCTLDFLVDDDVSYSANSALTYQEQQHIKKYRALDEHGKKVTDMVLEAEYDRCVQEQETIYQPKKYIDRLPNIASAGIGDYLFDDIPFEKIEVDEDCQADFAIGIDGNSMEPTYSHNDVVLVKKQDSIRVGEIGIFIVDGECFIKEYGKDGLISHNKDYPDKKFNECMDIRLIGKVVGKL